MNETIINGIDVSEYFIDVVDEGGGTIDYKILPNSERLLVERIFEQNQQLKRLQEENEKLKARLKTLDDEVLTIEITPDEFERYKKYEQALEEMRKEANRLLFVENPIYGYNNSNYFEILAKHVLAKTNEALKDRD